MSERQAVAAVITPDRRFDQAGALSIPAASQRQKRMTRIIVAHGRNTLELFRLGPPGYGIADQRSKLLIGHGSILPSS